MNPGIQHSGVGPRLRLQFLPLIFVLAASAQKPDAAFFESKIRPVLAAKCYGCHSSKVKAPMGGLVLDTKAGTLKGGALGPALVPGKPAESNLLKALRYSDPHLQMPPTGKLSDSVISDFEQWIAAGAPDPRKDAPSAVAATAPLRGMPVEEGRKWWAFQPVAEKPLPGVNDRSWPRNSIDAFILAKLEQKGLRPSPPADPRGTRSPRLCRSGGIQAQLRRSASLRRRQLA